jgi:hypothetical protein
MKELEITDDRHYSFVDMIMSAREFKKTVTKIQSKKFNLNSFFLNKSTALTMRAY